MNKLSTISDRLPSIWQPALKIGQTIVQKFITDGKIKEFAATKISDHVIRVSGYIIEKQSCLVNYAPDIKALHKLGIPMKQIAETLGISLSYAYKLLKK